MRLGEGNAEARQHPDDWDMIRLAGARTLIQSVLYAGGVPTPSRDGSNIAYEVQFKGWILAGIWPFLLRSIKFWP